MSYVFAAVYVALGALYLFLAATGKPGMAAWCVSAALAVSLACFWSARHADRARFQLQQQVIDAQADLLKSKDQLIELLVEKAGLSAEWGAAKAEAQALVCKGGA